MQAHSLNDPHYHSGPCIKSCICRCLETLAGGVLAYAGSNHIPTKGVQTIGIAIRAYVQPECCSISAPSKTAPGDMDSQVAELLQEIGAAEKDLDDLIAIQKAETKELDAGHRAVAQQVRRWRTHMASTYHCACCCWRPV
jgi:hypothetical protein